GKFVATFVSVAALAGGGPEVQKKSNDRSCRRHGHNCRPSLGRAATIALTFPDMLEFVEGSSRVSDRGIPGRLWHHSGSRVAIAQRERLCQEAGRKKPC